MGIRVILTKDNHLFSLRWINLWNLPRKDKKLWFREVAEEIKYVKQIR